MMTRKPIFYLIPILILGLLPTLSACGQNAASRVGSGSMPTSLQITIISVVGPQDKRPVVKVTKAETVQQLYTTTTTLPQMPKDIACTAEMGPSYQLTFYNADKKLLTANAQHYGCRSTRIDGEQDDRQAIPEFWTLLDKAISTDLPIAQTKQLSILQTFAQPQQVARAAQITDTATSQRLRALSL